MKEFNFKPSRNFSFQDMYDSLTPPEPDNLDEVSNEGMVRENIAAVGSAKKALSMARRIIKKLKGKTKNADIGRAIDDSMLTLSALIDEWDEVNLSESLSEAGLPSQYTNKIKGIPSKAFDWFMKYQTQFDKKDFGFKKLNISKVSVNTSALTDKQRGRVVAKLGFKNHKSQASALEKIIASAREKWSDIQTLAHMETYGEKPGFGSYKVSGIGDNKYSDTHKKQLRTLAHMETIFKSARDAHKAAAKLTELSSAEAAFETLKAIIGTLRKQKLGAKGKDMLKMAQGIRDFYGKEKSFSPDQAKWIFNTSTAMFKESAAAMTDAQFKKLMKDIRKKAAEIAALQKQYRAQTGRDLRV